MVQRDVLKVQIEQLGKVLGKMLAAFLHQKSEGAVVQGMHIANEKIKATIGIDLADFLRLPETEWQAHCLKNNLQAEHLEILAAYLKAAGESKIKTNETEGKEAFLNAIRLLDMADRLTKTTSFDRINQKAAIRALCL